VAQLPPQFYFLRKRGLKGFGEDRVQRKTNSSCVLCLGAEREKKSNGVEIAADQARGVRECESQQRQASDCRMSVGEWEKECEKKKEENRIQ
jgi:hypothetical protein